MGNERENISLKMGTGKQGNAWVYCGNKVKLGQVGSLNGINSMGRVESNGGSRHCQPVFLLRLVWTLVYIFLIWMH